MYRRHEDKQTKQKIFYSFKQQPYTEKEEEKEEREIINVSSHTFEVKKRKNERKCVVIHTQHIHEWSQ